MFLDKPNPEIEEIFAELAYSYVYNKDMVFVLHIEGINKDHDYNSRYFRY